MKARADVWAVLQQVTQRSNSSITSHGAAGRFAIHHSAISRSCSSASRTTTTVVIACGGLRSRPPLDETVRL
jgi:hypothetical protein